MKTVRVAAAIIRSGHKIFATQRGYGEFKDGWEFPAARSRPGRRPRRLWSGRSGKSWTRRSRWERRSTAWNTIIPLFICPWNASGPDPLRGTDLKRTRGRQMALPGRTGQCGLAAADLSLIRKIREQMQAEEGML